MTYEVTIFNQINARPDFNYSGAQIAKWSGLEKSLISRFLNGKSDISLSKFLQLIRSMPSEFQQAYWSESLGVANVSQMLERERIPWTELIKQATHSDIEEILSALTERWGKLSKSQEKELANVG